MSHCCRLAPSYTFIVSLQAKNGDEIEIMLREFISDFFVTDISRNTNTKQFENKVLISNLDIFCNRLHEDDVVVDFVLEELV